MVKPIKEKKQPDCSCPHKQLRGLRPYDLMSQTKTINIMMKFNHQVSMLKEDFSSKELNIYIP